MTEEISVKEMTGYRLKEPGRFLRSDSEIVSKALPVDDNGSKVAGVSK